MLPGELIPWWRPHSWFLPAGIGTDLPFLQDCGGQSCQDGVGGLSVGWQICQRPGCLLWTSRKRGIFGSFVQPVGLLLALRGSEKEDRQNLASSKSPFLLLWRSSHAPNTSLHFMY